MNEHKPQKRVVTYVSEEEYNKFRALLLLKYGKTVSGWFRDKIKEFLKTHK